MLGFRRRLEREGRAARGCPHSFPSAQGPQSRTAAVLGSGSPVPRVWAGPQPSVRGRRASAIPVRAFQSSIACPRRGLVTFGASPGCCGRLCRAAPHSSPREARASALPGLHERRAGARGLCGHCRLMAGIFPELAVASRWLSPAGLCSWACRWNLSKATRTPETSREGFSSSFSCFSHRWFLANEVLYLRSYLSLDLQTLQQEGWQQLVCGVLGHLCAKRCAEPWVEATHFLSDSPWEGHSGVWVRAVPEVLWDVCSEGSDLASHVLQRYENRQQRHVHKQVLSGGRGPAGFLGGQVRALSLGTADGSRGSSGPLRSVQVMRTPSLFIRTTCAFAD